MSYAAVLVALLKLPLHFFLELVYFLFRCRPKKEIKNEHILITGAAQGIGAEFAWQFAEMGNTVHCVDIDIDLQNQTVEALKSKGHAAFAYTCDLTKADQVEGLHKKITDAGYAITVLVNNAGVAFCVPLTDMSLTQIQHSVGVNVVANMWLIKLFLPKMVELGKGHVVNIASLLGKMPTMDATDYCCAKAGSIHMMTQLRMQYVKTDLKFTAVCPFFVKTRMIEGVEDIVEYMLPKDLVAAAITGVREDKDVVAVPCKYNLMQFVISILPAPLLQAFYRYAYDEHLKTFRRKYIGQKMSEKVA